MQFVTGILLTSAKQKFLKASERDRFTLIGCEYRSNLKAVTDFTELLEHTNFLLHNKLKDYQNKVTMHLTTMSK